MWRIDAYENPEPAPRAPYQAPSRAPINAPLICKDFFTGRLAVSEPEITVENYANSCIESTFIFCYQRLEIFIKSMLSAV
jgi:hypothetical protein